jgi:hypothetical protein
MNRVKTQTAELVRDDLGGAKLFESNLWMHVDVVSNLGELGREFLEKGLHCG